jgi:nucleotide-binding universal stress UspA family protein
MTRGASVLVGIAVPHPHVPIVAIQSYGAAALAEEIANIHDQGSRHARETAERTAARLKSRGFAAEAVVLDGEPGSALLEFSEREHVDIIALGSRGQGAIQSLLLGSVARKLVSHANCSVLVGRCYSENGPEESVRRLEGLDRMAAIVAVDGSDGATAGMDVVMRSGQGAFAKVVAVCAEPLNVVPAGVDPTAFSEFYQYDRERVEATAKSAAERLAPAAEQVSWRTNLGRPADVINELAASERADLIVLGATRHGAVERFLIGSVSYEVATTAPCSVFIVRP